MVHKWPLGSHEQLFVIHFSLCKYNAIFFFYPEMGNAENKFLDCLKWKTILKHSIFEPFISGFIIFQKPIEIIIR
jgi:hypothetical protein